MDTDYDLAQTRPPAAVAADAPAGEGSLGGSFAAALAAREIPLRRMTDASWRVARSLALPIGLLAARRRSVIVCASGFGRRLRGKLLGSPGTMFCGYFDDRGLERLRLGQGERLLGRLRDIPAVCREQRIDVVYIALPLRSEQRVADLLAQLGDTTVSVYLIPEIPLLGPMRPYVDIVGGTPMVAVCETPFRSYSAIVKRCEDVLFATLLALGCLPAMLIIAAAIKLESAGPVLFRQRRYGIDGKEIVIYKFRSMKVLEDGPELRQARAVDPRVTRVGAVLRRYSLDELPQLFNVLQGRMSLVGPRPHAIAHNELYRKLIRGYMIRHKVRPGITGWAQVNGLRGETDTLEKMKARVEHDLAYLSEWSVALDLWILFRTIRAVIGARNAH